ncbi:MAG: hypothetical protein KDC54_14450 [Lewinella sp.]|nr:hypothetical protein [Lewinella sp.]
MQLQRIQDQLEAYAQWLTTDAARERLYYWESQQQWQTHWDLEAIDPAAMYDASLQNSRTRRLWKREAYEPKQMMLHFLRAEPEFVRSMFLDLFNEDKSVDGRADRFVFYCDQLLEQYRRAHPLAIDTSHYHDDGYEIVSLYLAFRFPEQYAPYQAPVFLQLLKRLGAANIPLVGDFARHVKVTRTLMNFLTRHDTIMARHAERLGPEHYPGASALLAFDFACFVTERD